MIHIHFNIRDCLNPFGSPRPKTERTTDAKYYDWFLENNPICCVPTCSQPATRDHVICGRSRNSRASDFLIVNLCQQHNMNRGGVEEFEKRNGVDFAEIIERNWQLYALHVGLTGSFASLQEIEVAFKKGKKWKRAA